MGESAEVPTLAYFSIPLVRNPSRSGTSNSKTVFLSLTVDWILFLISSHIPVSRWHKLGSSRLLHLSGVTCNDSFYWQNQRVGRILNRLWKGVNQKLTNSPRLMSAFMRFDKEHPLIYSQDYGPWSYFFEYWHILQFYRITDHVNFYLN